MTAEQAIASNAAENQWMNSALAAPTSLWGATGTAPFAVNAALAPGAAASAGGSGLLSTLGALSLAKQGLGMLGGGVPQSQVPNYNIASVPMSQYKGYTPTNFMSNTGSPSGSTPTQVAMMTPTEKETLLQAVLKSKPKEFAKYIG